LNQLLDVHKGILIEFWQWLRDNLFYMYSECMSRSLYRVGDDDMDFGLL